MSLKLDIRPFDGKNWPTWKFQIVMLLKTHTGALDAVQGTLTKPTQPDAKASPEAISKYKVEYDAYQRNESTAFLLLTTNMTENMLAKVMRFTTAKEAWDELNRLYERVSQDRFYDVCMQFFGYKLDPNHDMGTHLTTAKNLWHEVNLILTKQGKSELPEMLLICKVMDSLPDEYFSFKSSWALMSLADHTIENLTTQLCAYERSLNQKNLGEGESSSELLMVRSEKRYENLKTHLYTPILRVDNESAIKLANNPPYEQHRKTKHIKLKHFYVRQCVCEGDITIEQVPTTDQLADILTKPVYKPRLVKLCEEFGLKRREC